MSQPNVLSGTAKKRVVAKHLTENDKPPNKPFVPSLSLSRLRPKSQQAPLSARNSIPKNIVTPRQRSNSSERLDEQQIPKSSAKVKRIKQATPNKSDEDSHSSMPTSSASEPSLAISKFQQEPSGLKIISDTQSLISDSPHTSPVLDSQRIVKNIYEDGSPEQQLSETPEHIETELTEDFNSEPLEFVKDSDDLINTDPKDLDSIEEVRLLLQLTQIDRQMILEMNKKLESEIDAIQSAALKHSSQPLNIEDAKTVFADNLALRGIIDKLKDHFEAIRDSDQKQIVRLQSECSFLRDENSRLSTDLDTRTAQCGYLQGQLEDLTVLNSHIEEIIVEKNELEERFEEATEEIKGLHLSCSLSEQLEQELRVAESTVRSELIKVENDLLSVLKENSMLKRTVNSLERYVFDLTQQLSHHIDNTQSFETPVFVRDSHYDDIELRSQLKDITRHHHNAMLAEMKAEESTLTVKYLEAKLSHLSAFSFLTSMEANAMETHLASLKTAELAHICSSFVERGAFVSPTNETDDDIAYRFYLAILFTEIEFYSRRVIDLLSDPINYIELGRQWSIVVQCEKLLETCFEKIQIQSYSPFAISSEELLHSIEDLKGVVFSQTSQSQTNSHLFKKIVLYCRYLCVLSKGHSFNKIGQFGSFETLFRSVEEKALALSKNSSAKDFCDSLILQNALNLLADHVNVMQDAKHRMFEGDSKQNEISLEKVIQLYEDLLILSKKKNLNNVKTRPSMPIVLPWVERGKRLREQIELNSNLSQKIEEQEIKLEAEIALNQFYSQKIDEKDNLITALKKKADDLFSNLGKLNCELLAKNEEVQKLACELAESKSTMKITLAKLSKGRNTISNKSESKDYEKELISKQNNNTESKSFHGAYHTLLTENSLLLQLFTKDAFSRLPSLRESTYMCEDSMMPLQTVIALAEDYKEIPKLSEKKPTLPKLNPFFSLREQYALLEECINLQ